MFGYAATLLIISATVDGLREDADILDNVNAFAGGVADV